MEKEVKDKKPRKKVVKAEEVSALPQEEVHVPKPVAAKKKSGLPAALAMATGRRKTAVAQVKIYRGEGNITLNGKDVKDYLCGRYVLITTVCKPLETVNMRDKYDIVAVLRGGGIPGQADAVRMGIA